MSLSKNDWEVDNSKTTSASCYSKSSTDWVSKHFLSERTTEQKSNTPALVYNLVASLIIDRDYCISFAFVSTSDSKSADFLLLKKYTP